jgi:aldose 1-epimerase
MRDIERRRRLRWPFVIMAAVIALVIGGSVAATQALAASSTPAAASGAHLAGVSVTKQFFGFAKNQNGVTQAVYRYTLRNSRGMSVQVMTYGATTQTIKVPDRFGRTADVVLGFKTLQDYVDFDSPPVAPTTGVYFGETVGRYANRIANGKFTLNQPGVGPVHYTVPVNNGPNSLHGGIIGFGNYIWSSQALAGPGFAGVRMSIISPNKDQSFPAGSPGCPSGCTGYPAALKVTVTFTLNNANQYRINYKATNLSSNLNTVLNLTNHSYFNLAGESAPPGSAYGQYITINAKKYTPTNSTQIPLGYEASVFGTPFNFTTPFQMGARITDASANFNAPVNQLLAPSQGYDHNWVLNPQTPATTGPGGLNLAARAFDPGSGRVLTVWTNQPGVQFYTSNFLTGTLVGISGHSYRQGAAYTFETQHFPNSPNQPNFPSTELGPGKTFTSSTIFAFAS